MHTRIHQMLMLFLMGLWEILISFHVLFYIFQVSKFFKNHQKKVFMKEKEKIRLGKQIIIF